MVAGKKLVSSASLWQGRLSTSWSVYQECSQQMEGRDSSPHFITCETTCAGLCPALGLPAWERHWQTGASSAEATGLVWGFTSLWGCTDLAVTLWSYASICIGISVWIGHWHLILLIWTMAIVWDMAILCSETADVTKNCLLALLSLDYVRGALFTSVWEAICWGRLLLRANTWNVEESGST